MINHTNELDTSQYGSMDGIDQFQALKDSKSGPRKSVHIHRDWDRDGHAYRRGRWKIIVGHHFLPFLMSKVYIKYKKALQINNSSSLDFSETWREDRGSYL